MDTTSFVTFGWFGLVCAIIAGKWAAELGFSQSRQLLWAIFAFVLPPLALLVLYMRHLHQRADQNLPGAHWA